MAKQASRRYPYDYATVLDYTARAIPLAGSKYQVLSVDPQRGVITVRSWSEGDQVVIAIADTGTGIPPEAQDHVFEQFFTTREVGKGTGLGLSVAWRVVERHGGMLNFDTVPGQGTTFFLRLPSGQAQRKVAA